MSKISVIIPTYNRQGLIKDAILSALNQTYKNIEIIVVDDASTDGTEKSVSSFEDSRIIYLKHNKNMGVAATCNTGIKKATGEFIFILNDDDLIVPSAIEKLFKKINEGEIQNLGAVYGWSLWVNKEGKTYRIIDSKEKGEILKKIIKKHIFTNLLIKKEVFEEVGLYNEELRNNEDFDFYLRVASRYQFDFVSEILFIIRKHDQGHLSSFTQKNVLGQYKISENYSKDFNFKKLLSSIISLNFYIKLSNLKNFLICRVKLFLNPEITRQIDIAKKDFFNMGIKI